ncbi:hypothetical protein HN446_00405 [bacterium]|jgi:hypothetical protein|nr:hypothetical protein [bacterium]
MGKRGRYILSVTLFASLMFVFLFILTTANPPRKTPVSKTGYAIEA